MKDVIGYYENGLHKEWKRMKLIDVTSKITDGTHHTPKYIENGVPFISVKDIYNNKINFSNTKFISEEEHNELVKRCNPEEGDVLITKSGTIGRLAIVPKQKFSLFVSVALLKLNKDIIQSKFALYALQNHINHLDIKSQIKGGLLKNYHLEDLRLAEIPVPPIEEQQKIIAIIEELFSELDKSIEQLKTAQQQLKVYRQSVLKWAFEGKLTNENVKDGELPKGWAIFKTGEILNTINNGYTPTKEFLSEGSGEIPFIKVYNLNFDGTLNFFKNPTFIPFAIHKKDLKRSICYPGDVLTNIVGPPLGKVSIVSDQYLEWNINQAIVLFRPNEKILSKYLSYYLQNPSAIHWLESTSKATAGQFNIKVSTCREIPIPVPSIFEQVKIIQELESRLSVADKFEETITINLQLSEALRQSILKQAFEGKLI